MFNKIYLDTDTYKDGVSYQISMKEDRLEIAFFNTLTKTYSFCDWYNFTTEELTWILTHTDLE